MDLWLTRHDGYADDHIILPKDIKVVSLGTVTDEHMKITTPNSEDNVRLAKLNRCKPIVDRPLETRQLALWLNKNVIKLENTFDFVVGEDIDRTYLGPVIHELNGDTHAVLNRKDITFYGQSALGADGKPINRTKTKMYLTPGQNSMDRVVLVSASGTVVVHPKAILVLDLPVIVVKSNGEYFTIGKPLDDGRNHILRLKEGIAFALLVRINTEMVVVFLRKPDQQIKESQVKRESVEKAMEEKAQEVRQSLKSLHESKEACEPKEVQQTREPLPSVEVHIEEIMIHDLSDRKFVPDFVLDWIKGKGYQIETGGGTALLGIGAFDVVRLCTRMSDKNKFAIKIIVEKLDEKDTQPLKVPEEILIAKAVDHTNIIKAEEVFCLVSKVVPDKRDRKFSFIVMELAASRQTLEKQVEQVGRFAEDDARWRFRQVINALVYLHQHSIAHLRIRLDNCLVMNDQSIKLCDFSRADNMGVKTADPKLPKSYSLKLMPPEVFNETITDLFKVDVWMCGCLLVGLFTGNKEPFGHISREDFYTKNKTFKDFESRLNSGLQLDLGVSQTANQLVSALLQKDPNQRLDSRTVLDHNWFK